MKRILSLMLMTLTVAAAFASSNYEVVSLSALNVRQKPWPTAEIVGTLETGEIVEVTDIYNGWATIRFDGGKAYVVADYLKKYKGEKQPQSHENSRTALPTYKVVSEAPLNVREEPSSDSDVLGTLSPGKTVKVLDFKEDWARIRYRGKDGYVMTRFLEKVQ